MCRVVCTHQGKSGAQSDAANHIDAVLSKEGSGWSGEETGPWRRCLINNHNDVEMLKCVEYTAHCGLV